MKKLFTSKIYLFVALFFMIFSIFSCSKDQNKSDKLQVVAAIFPAYDWAKQITVDTNSFDVSLLLKNGTDLHSYQPSVDDIIKIKNSDVFIYVGGESDKWIQDVIDSSASQKTTYVNLMDCLKEYLVKEEIVEGMQSSHNDEGDSDYDEHIWLALENAEYLCQRLTKIFQFLDPLNELKYYENCKEYISKIAQLKSEYQNIFSQTRNNSIIVCDRFPFRYLTKEFNLQYYAAFSGCSAETDASFETVVFLADKLSQLNKPCVFRIENSSNKLCETVIANSSIKDCQIVSLDSMQSTTLKQAESGKNYLDTMRYNLNQISKSVK